jgi:tripartite-type tricarboxylate transporter receptor subunit TctC
MILRRHLIVGAAGLAAAPLAAPALVTSARAQSSWPNAPVRFVVPFAAGGPTDVPARLIADELSKMLPQRVIVENRTGAGVVVGSDVVAKAPKDGQTLLYTTIAHAALRSIFPSLPFDPLGDFTPVALTGVIPMLMMVNKDLPVNSLPELIELFKKNPGKYDYASTGNGAALHLASELFLKQAGGLKVNHVPYRGSAAAMPDLLNGSVVMMLDVANSALPFVTRGEVKGLAISGMNRLSQVPNIPTFNEAGVPGYEAYTWHMVMAPAGTPEPIVKTVNEAINKVMAMASVQERLSALTMETRSNTTPATAKKWLDDEIAKWEPIIKEAGIKAN